MTVATYAQSNFTVDDPTTYRGKLDGNCSVATTIVDNFAPHAAATPNMTIVCDGGRIPSVGVVPATQAQQATGLVSVPVANPRTDIAYIDAISGNLGYTTGTESVTPVDPAIPAGKIAIARLAMTVGMTTITNSIITDLRAPALAASGGGLTGQVYYTANTVLPSSAFGQGSQVANGVALTLPVSNGVAGQLLYLYGSGGSGTFSITNNAGQFIYCPAIGMGATTGTTTLTVQNGGSAVLLARGGGEFDVIGGSVLITNNVNPLPVPNATASNHAVALGQANTRYVLSGADGTAANERILSASYNIVAGDSGLFFDAWNIPANGVLGTPASVTNGFNVGFTGAINSNVTLKNNTVNPLYFPDGSAIAAGASFVIPQIPGSSFELRFFAGVLFLRTSGRTIVANAVNANEAVGLGQANGAYAALAGLTTQVFRVANGVGANDAVAFGQTNGPYVPKDAGSGGVGATQVLLNTALAVGQGSTVAGASLYFVHYTGGVLASAGNTAAAGTWRLLDQTCATNDYGTFQRIA